MATELRQSGIDILGAIPWGTHFWCFHETKQDMLDILCPYFAAGLESHEFCLWVIADPLTEQEAKAALGRAVPDLDRYLVGGSIEFVPATDWFLAGGTYDARRFTRGWNEKLAQALTRGYRGMRLSGDVAWLNQEHWPAFVAYEEMLNDTIAGQRITVLCNYSLDTAGGAQILDLVRTHQFAMGKRRGAWEIIETAELKQAKDEIRRLNAELEERVAARTRELVTLNEELRKEIAERERAETAVRGQREQLAALSRRLLEAQEAERRSIARELHDDLGQVLTAVRLNLGKAGADRESIDLVDQAIGRTRDLALEVRPAMLDDLGLASALRWYGAREAKRAGLMFHANIGDLDGRLPAVVEITCFRLVQEALTNVARHAQAQSVTVTLNVTPEQVALVVSDDGRGFDPGEVGRRAVAERLGLIGMQERVSLAGGQFELVTRPGRGTEVRARFPRSGRDGS